MVWSGWIVPPPPPGGVFQPPPAGLDIEEEIPDPAEVAARIKPKPQPPRIRKSRADEFIEVELIQRVLDERNGLELNWLQELLEDGVRVLNTTGRYLKADRFLDEITKARTP